MALAVAEAQRTNRGDDGRPHNLMNRATCALIYVLLAAVVGGCGFEEDLSPIDWPAYPEPAAPGAVESEPLPYPSPTSPFLQPGAPVPFQGAASLNCSQPYAGDNHYGYCLIPGTQEVYVWGECEAECPDGPYPGIEILRVPFAESAVFMAVIDGRDTAMDQRREGTVRGSVLGGLGASLGIPGIIEVCGATGPWGCALAVGAVVVDGLLAWDQYSDGRAADTELNEPRRGYEFSAEDQFRLLRQGREPESDLLP